MTVLFDIQDLSVGYERNGKESRVFRYVEFSVEPAELLVITGPSGSGKSSLLAALSGSVTPMEGRVLYKGEDVHAFDSARLDAYRNEEIGVVLQFFGLVGDMTALENVMLPALIRGETRSSAAERAAELLICFGLKDKASKRVSMLSGGQQQRVAIARALMNNPWAILADEPTANLDESAARKVMDTFAELCKEQERALIVATHDGRMVACADSLLELT